MTNNLGGSDHAGIGSRIGATHRVIYNPGTREGLTGCYLYNISWGLDGSLWVR